MIKNNDKFFDEQETVIRMAEICDVRSAIIMLTYFTVRKVIVHIIIDSEWIYSKFDGFTFGFIMTRERVFLSHIICLSPIGRVKILQL